MTKSKTLVEKYLLEADLKVSQQIVDKAIKEGKSILIAKTQKDNNNTLETNIIMKPTEIKDDLVLGTTEKNNQPFQANLTDVVSIMNESINFQEDLKPAIDSDSNHEIVEEYTNLLKLKELPDYNKNQVESNFITEEELMNQDSPKELAIYNIKNWANELNLDLGNQTEKGDLTSFTLNTRGTEDRLKEQPTVYIYPEGGIMISGHRVKTFKDLSLIINFLKDTNS